MLTGSPERTRTALIEIRSTMTRLALEQVLQLHGWVSACACRTTCGCVRISDRLPTPGSRLDVLVVRDEPAACQDALTAAIDGRIRAIVLWNTPEDLGPTCEGLERNVVTIPESVLELAGIAPCLTPRQREGLRLLAHGLSSAGIAQALHQSESTVKRDIAELLRLFDAPNRAALVWSAASLGFVTTPRSRPEHARACPEPTGDQPRAGLPT